MRKTLGNMVSCLKDEKGYLLNAENGCLRIRIYGPDIIRFDYFIKDHKVPACLEEASASMVLLDCPEAQSELDGCTITSGDVRIVVDGIGCNVSVYRKGALVHGGRAGDKDTVIPQSQFRLLGEKGSEIGRFIFPLKASDRFHGLGDKAGSPDHRGKRLRLYNKDSLGYDASFSDPLYKSIPFLIKTNPEDHTSCGLFVAAPDIEAVDLGKESPFYYSIDVSSGPFSLFLILGDDYKDIIGSYYKITGRPALPPLYSFGYLGSSMNYVEAYDAQSRIMGFFSDVERHSLPCEGMYVSSGYLKTDDGFRHAFMWNKRKFPDPKAFVQSLSKRGYHLTFNIKPGILKTHPLYEDLDGKGYFIKDNDGRTIVEYFWGGDASFVDFNNPDAVTWWKGMLKQSYLDHGVQGIWNDNNEFEMEDPAQESYKIRTLYPVKMAQASYEACLAKDPSVRPWIYSRSGYAGMQRYARTWSGDNSSDFKTLRYNQFQGASLALSGVPFFGHDLGGFYGSEPSPELLVRCCQSAVFQSRFVIHSWRENDEPTEPWKIPEAFPLIREAIEDHYRHIPYIYNEAKKALCGAPLERLLCLEYPNDSELDAMTEQFMFGSSVMKAPVLNEGQRTKNVHFPDGDDWYSPRLGVFFKGGENVELDAPLDVNWFFYKTGSVIPRSGEVSRLETGYFRSLELFMVPKNGSCVLEYDEDDGVSVIGDGNHNIWRVSMDYDQKTGKGSIRINLSHLGDLASIKGRSLKVVLPEGFALENPGPIAMESADKAVLRFSGQYRQHR